MLFQSKDEPTYLPGLRGVLGIFVALAACTIIQAANLTFLNKLQERKREQNGKPKKIKDLSMEDHYHDVDEGEEEYGAGLAVGDVPAAPGQHTKIGGQAFLDLTDRQNDEFVYVL